jgi:hypothetical protein
MSTCWNQPILMSYDESFIVTQVGLKPMIPRLRVKHLYHWDVKAAAINFIHNKKNYWQHHTTDNLPSQKLTWKHFVLRWAKKKKEE